MLGIEELKEKIEVTDTEVECPVKECSERVERRKRQTQKKEYNDRFRCPEHKIVISPSTFVYPNESDNLLWKERSDLELFNRTKAVKRVSWMDHDNSEDAVSWNVFRFLERNNLVEGLLGSITDTSPKSSEVIYWSYSPREEKGYSLLNQARDEFGEKISQGSEPDIIIRTDDALFFIEAKLKSPNKDSSLQKKDPSYISRRLKKYMTGGENWFFKVFHSDFETVAIDEQLYELLRFWLLGTWMAEQQYLDFYLVNLVLSKNETDIESIFGRHINDGPRRKFQRITWEDIYQYISECTSSRDRNRMMRYFRNKTIGYDGKGRLQKAFTIHVDNVGAPPV